MCEVFRPHTSRPWSRSSATIWLAPAVDYFTCLCRSSIPFSIFPFSITSLKFYLNYFYLFLFFLFVNSILLYSLIICSPQQSSLLRHLFFFIFFFIVLWTLTHLPFNFLFITLFQIFLLFTVIIIAARLFHSIISNFIISYSVAVNLSSRSYISLTLFFF